MSTGDRDAGEHRPLRIVLVGYGPVGARFVEELLPALSRGDITLTVVGAEREDAYNRVLIAEYAVGIADRVRLDVTDTAAAVAAGVRVELGAAVTGLDRDRQVVRLDTGETLPYDRLVLATGARANVPTLAGLTGARHERGAVSSSADGLDRGPESFPDGVVALRDLADAERIRRTVRSGGAVVVLGAGVLGVEFALLVAEHTCSPRDVGLDVVIAHQGAVPMARNVDSDGGRVLADAIRRSGVGLAAHVRAEAVETVLASDGRRRFSALLGADGSRIPGDLLVLSCGVSPRTELAESSGLAVDRGVLVDEELRSWTDPSVHALGDCANVVETDAIVTSGPSGLIGPGWRQAARLAERLSREARHDAVTPVTASWPPGERPAVVMLKSTGVDLVSGGDVRADPWDSSAQVATWLDPRRSRYCKTVVRDGVLSGFVTIGLPRTAAELTLLFERGSAFPSDPLTLLRLDVAGGQTAPTSLDPDATLCACNAVSSADVAAAVSAGAHSVEAIGTCTRAGTGCGGCRGRIEQVLAAAGIVRAVP